MGWAPNCHIRLVDLLPDTAVSTTLRRDGADFYAEYKWNGVPGKVCDLLMPLILERTAVRHLMLKTARGECWQFTPDMLERIHAAAVERKVHFKRLEEDRW